MKPRKGFLMLPHDLLRMWLKEGLSGTEWEALLLLAWWTIGYKDRPSCSAGTTSLSNQTVRSRQNIAKAVKRLEERGLILRVRDRTARKATQWGVAKTRQGISRRRHPISKLRL